MGRYAIWRQLLGNCTQLEAAAINNLHTSTTTFMFGNSAWYPHLLPWDLKSEMRAQFSLEATVEPHDLVRAKGEFLTTRPSVTPSRHV